MLRVSGGRMVVHRHSTAYGVQHEICTRNSSPHTWTGVVSTSQHWLALVSTC